jgi:transposase
LSVSQSQGAVLVCSTQGVFYFRDTWLTFRAMYFKCSIRRNPETGAISGYYRLVESYRNADDRVCHRTILNVGFMEDTTAGQRQKIQTMLRDKYEMKQSVFSETDPVVNGYVSALWQRIVEEKRLDIGTIEKRGRMIDVETMVHSNAREAGSEWMCHQTWERLGLSALLASQGWNDEQIQLAAAHVVGRAVYPASELRMGRWMKENSAICELTGYDINKVSKDKLYQSALNLYGLKDVLEKHLSAKTNELFDLQDKIILYDLTNTYFEGSKRGSKLAKFGRSKEHRSDAKLVVLALVVNMEGFIKYSAIHEGNMSDSRTLPQMIDKLATHTCTQTAVVVLDAGIATEDNLKLIAAKGYHYLCVSRTKLKDYSINPNRLTVMMETRSKQNVRIKAIQTDEDTDYYLEIKSDAKTVKEQSMATQFEERFEAYLARIQQALPAKGGVKKADKVWERIGRAKEKYPSVHHYYDIKVSVDETKGIATALHWEKQETRHQARETQYGMYFLRTSLKIADEVIIWNIYNTIREIEQTFRTLKTELDLRPVYHKTDKATMAHLHLGILAYWLVNTIRCQLKSHGINHSWTEIVRIGNTQKIVTTSGQNTFDKTVTVRKCTQPDEKLSKLLQILKISPKPFSKRKSVVHKLLPRKNQTNQNQFIMSG